MDCINAMIVKADVCFFPELSESELNLHMAYDKGTAILHAVMNADTMFKVLSIFGKMRLSELAGQCCRMICDKETGHVYGIRNILSDEFGELQEEPVTWRNPDTAF